MSETRVAVIHTFYIFKESKMCLYTHYLIISGYIFLQKHYTMYVTHYLIILEYGKFKTQGVVICYFLSNPLCAKFACVWLNNYSIDFDQTSVKSRSVTEKKITELRGSNFRNRSVCKLHSKQFLRILKCVTL